MNWEPIVTHVMSGGVGGLVVAGVWLLKRFIGEKLRAAIQHKYDKKLESFRAKVELEMQQLRESASQVQAVHAAAMGTVLESHRAAQERRLASIETFWRAMVHLRMTTPVAVDAIDMFTDDQYRTGEVFKKDMLGVSSGSLGPESLTDQDKEIDKEVQFARAFGTEYMYALFFAYRALIWSIILRLQVGAKYGQMRPWFEDEGIRTLLASIFTKEEMEGFEADPHLRYRRVQEGTERKMLAHINDIVTGKTLSQSVLEQASTMLAAAVKLQRESPKEQA